MQWVAGPPDSGLGHPEMQASTCSPFAPHCAVMLFRTPTMPVTRNKVERACRARASGAALGVLLGMVQRLTQEDLQNALVREDDEDDTIVGWLQTTGQWKAQSPSLSTATASTLCTIM